MRVALVVIIFTSLWSEKVICMGLEELKGKRLNKSLVAELLADKNWTQDEKLTAFFGEDTYVNPYKKSVLSVDYDGKRGMLFDDKETVYRVVCDQNVLKPKHMLQNIFKYGADFPKQSRALSENFIKSFFVHKKENVESHSMESLRFIDEYITRNGTEEFFRPEIFASLLAYVGESVKKNYSMDWSMIKVEEDLWEPWLVDKASKEYPIFSPVYKELYNYQVGSSSLYGAVVGEIQKYRLPR